MISLLSSDGRHGVGASSSRERRCPCSIRRSESPRESIVRVHLVRFGLPRPVCNLDVFHDDAWVARVDIAWPEALLAVEYDGMGHLDEGQRRRDAWRRNALQRAGWLVITLTVGRPAAPGPDVPPDRGGLRRAPPHPLSGGAWPGPARESRPRASTHRVSGTWQSARWSSTSPHACIAAYIVVGPTNTKPWAFRALLSAVDSAVTAGTSASDVGRARRGRREGPHQLVEAAPGVLKRQEGARVGDGRLDLATVADDAGVRHQPLHVGLRRTRR